MLLYSENFTYPCQPIEGEGVILSLVNWKQEDEVVRLSKNFPAD